VLLAFSNRVWGVFSPVKPTPSPVPNFSLTEGSQTPPHLLQRGHSPFQCTSFVVRRFFFRHVLGLCRACTIILVVYFVFHLEWRFLLFFFPFPPDLFLRLPLFSFQSLWARASSKFNVNSQKKIFWACFFSLPCSPIP